MRYLFFDIECCNGRNICEFGYVITDINFNILEKRDITMNPKNKKFNLVGRPDREDLILFYPEDVYYRSPMFKEYYKEIKELIEFPDQLIIGHSIINDAKFLNIACWDFKLPPINFKFADSQKMYKDFYDVKNQISLENAGEQFAVEKPKYLHKSDDDSELTMGLVRNMCRSLDCTLEELIDLCDSCTGSNISFVNKYDDEEYKFQKRYEAYKSGEKNRIRGKSLDMFNYYLENVKRQGNVIQSIFNNKTWCISMNYEIYHFREMVALVQLLKNRGAEYINKSSECNIFISFNKLTENGEPCFCSRLRFANKAIEEGKEIQIISFDDVLKELNMSENDLHDYPFPEKDMFMNSHQKTGKIVVNKAKKNNRPLSYIPKDQPKSNLGSIFADLFNELKDSAEE